jgi:hypothetical protein
MSSFVEARNYGYTMPRLLSLRRVVNCVVKSTIVAIYMKCKIMYSYCRMNKKSLYQRSSQLCDHTGGSQTSENPPKRIFSFDTRLVILIVLLFRVSKWTIWSMPYCSYFPSESFSEPSAQSEGTERGLPHRRRGARGVCDYRRTDPISV